MITRRIILRLMLLRPTQSLVQSFLFILGYLQTKFDVEYHNLCCLSDHLHLMLTDVLGDQVQGFMRELFSLTGRSTNCFLGRRENFWNSDKPNCVMLAPLLDTLIAEGSYINANPVEAGLVSHSKHWKGCQVRPSELGKTVIRVRRPRFFFSPKGDLPDEVEVRFTVPRALDATPEEVQKRMCEELNRIEQEVRDRFKAAGRSFMGMKRVQPQARESTAKSHETWFGLKPTVACKDTSLRVKFLAWKKERRRKYDEKRAQLLAGNRNVRFPEGTYALHVHSGLDREPWQGCIWQRLMADP